MSEYRSIGHIDTHVPDGGQAYPPRYASIPSADMCTACARTLKISPLGDCNAMAVNCTMVPPTWDTHAYSTSTSWSHQVEEHLTVRRKRLAEDQMPFDHGVRVRRADVQVRFSPWIPLAQPTQLDPLGRAVLVREQRQVRGRRARDRTPSLPGPCWKESSKSPPTLFTSREI